ncbi:hypothetical protein CPLU01_13931 [Colletotrichum plurivorum]|uniref:Uncharacterized protein n=1 Tax=Colletotrichum plurivorum TaxID=2175906 RepID=A0A8H6JNY0_9PEZI|nr:hypothetical protein CPLU01_13931 [Colletotrichum plurivorum]
MCGPPRSLRSSHQSSSRAKALAVVVASWPASKLQRVTGQGPGYATDVPAEPHGELCEVTSYVTSGVAKIITALVNNAAPMASCRGKQIGVESRIVAEFVAQSRGSGDLVEPGGWGLDAVRNTWVANRDGTFPIDEESPLAPRLERARRWE